MAEQCGIGARMCAANRIASVDSIWPQVHVASPCIPKKATNVA